jgi:hypothetical protein
MARSMLTPYDDLPIHQVPTTLDQAATSDPRFFDRYWFIVYAEDGSVGLAVGLGVYKNTGVVDGFASVVVDGVQHNLRASRALRSDLSPWVGPINIDVVEGLKRFRLRADANENSPISFDLEWTAAFDAFEEAHHHTRVAGYVTQDYRRFYQHGRASGAISVAGRTFDGEFWTFRDRSFGVRPGMGGRMPTTAADHAPSDPSHIDPTGTAVLTFGGGFSTPDLSAACTFAETADGKIVDLNGRATRADGGPPDPFVAVSHDLQFHPNGVVRGGAVTYTTASGAEIALTLTELMHPMAYIGFGYLDGWGDRLGLGAYRGDVLEESDVFDVYDVSAVRDQSGAREFGAFTLLDQPFAITANGASGCMEVVAALRPGHQRYSLGSKEPR